MAAAALLAAAASGQEPPAGGDKFPLPDRPPAAPDPATVRGALAVQAVQGTPGGPPIGPADVEVRLMHGDVAVATFSTRLDEHGVVMLEPLPLEMAVVPVVTVDYAGVHYRRAGDVMSAENRFQKIEVPCYEPTDEPPPWTVKMRHVMLTPGSGGVEVTEILVIDNPADRTWTGRRDGGPDPVTTVLDLPAAARDLVLGAGFENGCCTTIAGGRLLNHLPLAPRSTELSFSYTVPAVQGTATIRIAAPTAVGQITVLVPDVAGRIKTEGLTLQGERFVGETPVHYYVAANLDRGQPVSVSLTGLGGATIPDDADRSTGKIIAGVITALLVLSVVVVVFSRSAGPEPDPGA